MANHNLSVKDVSVVKFLVQALRWWAESPPPLLGWNRVKVFENLDATEVVKVALVDTSLQVKAKQCSASGNVLPLFDITK